MRIKITHSLIFILLIASCNQEEIETVDYRQEMRDFVIGISEYAKNQRPYFLIIPQNGQELISNTGEVNGSINLPYANAIDGCGRKDLFYGYKKDNKATSQNEKEYLLSFCDLYVNNDLEVLVIDYCHEPEKIDDSYFQNKQHGFISFAAPERELSVIPKYPTIPYQVNENDINSLHDAKNFLYLINTEQFDSKSNFIDNIKQTNFDLLIIDLFHNEIAFTADEIETIKNKQNGGTRLVLAYMSIGEAEDYRYYWQTEWNKNAPPWLDEENKTWKGNYKVKYWMDKWQQIIFGHNNAYLDLIIGAGFDGVYLDLIDAFEYYEQ